MGYYDRDDDSYTRTRDSSERSSNWRNESIFGRSNRRDDDGDWRTRRSTRGGSGNRNYQSRGSGDEGYGPDDDRDDLPRNETNHLIASNKVEGTAVYGRDGERLGHIYNFMVDKVSGHVEYAVMAYGGFLRMGERYFPLPWQTLDYDTRRGGYRIRSEEHTSEIQSLMRILYAVF